MFSRGKIDIFKVSVQIVATFSVPKIDTKSDAEKRCEKMRKKWLLARILARWAAFWTAQGVPRAAQERPKSGSRRPQELWKTGGQALCDALGRSWALLGAFFRFFVIFNDFLSIF